MLKVDEFIQPDSENEFPHLKFSYCSIPFKYQIDGCKGIDVHFKDGKSESVVEYLLLPKQSKQIFARDGRLNEIIVHIEKL